MARFEASGIAAVRQLVSRRGGLIGQCVALEVFEGSQDWHVYASNLGDLTDVVPSIGVAGAAGGDIQLGGAGTSQDELLASDIAAVEGLERYSSCVWEDLPVRWATERQMRESAEPHLDIMTLPSIGDMEHARSSKYLSRPHLDRPLRWIRGVDMDGFTPAWVPLICTYLFVSPVALGERIWNPISTGCASHTSKDAALLAGLLECIERESIAVLWLQQLSLPVIDSDSLPPTHLAYVNDFERHGAQVSLIDATTDLRVPTVYCLVRRPDQAVAQLVTCASETSGEDAALKALREAQSTLVALETNTAAPPEDVMDFHDTIHGAVYMADPERTAAFDFVDASSESVNLSSLPTLGEDPTEALHSTLAVLRERGLKAYAVDMTTDEGARSGFISVKAIVPGLVPLSFVHSSRFLGTPRLYELPAFFNQPISPEEDINPWPQPFA
ncbi:YcaO-like family protein [Brevibacterium luteolum]|uniref:YcaO-like family protein n=1 Tax=Brevibacterium luteolum TaxID=199591 RepID=UPI003B67CEDF